MVITLSDELESITECMHCVLFLGEQGFHNRGKVSICSVEQQNWRHTYCHDACLICGVPDARIDYQTTLLEARLALRFIPQR